MFETIMPILALVKTIWFLIILLIGAGAVITGFLFLTVLRVIQKLWPRILVSAGLILFGIASVLMIISELIKIVGN